MLENWIKTEPGENHKIAAKYLNYVIIGFSAKRFFSVFNTLPSFSFDGIEFYNMIFSLGIKLR